MASIHLRNVRAYWGLMLYNRLSKSEVCASHRNGVLFTYLSKDIVEGLHAANAARDSASPFSFLHFLVIF